METREETKCETAKRKSQLSYIMEKYSIIFLIYRWIKGIQMKYPNKGEKELQLAISSYWRNLLVPGLDYIYLTCCQRDLIANSEQPNWFLPISGYHLWYKEIFCTLPKDKYKLQDRDKPLSFYGVLPARYVRPIVIQSLWQYPKNQYHIWLEVPSMWHSAVLIFQCIAKSSPKNFHL